MSSLIPGFEYDIFISYRQKDNKYDGWVTEFVDNLKKELEATFKEDISVYFDINPHDGLLETHDVDASLQDKLKCLVFIPIISRTYCDPKSFAWDHEFKAFVEKALQDQYGLKVKLPNGNVTNRILPIRINDLNISDIKLCESILGGILRGVDFIYKSAGVNRPLRSKDDEIIKSTEQLLYRDQINKVALTVMDIIESIKVSKVQGQVSDKEIQVMDGSTKNEPLIDLPLQEEIIITKQEVAGDNTKHERRRKFLLLRKPMRLVPGVLIIMFIILTSVFMLNHFSKVRWAKEVSLPKIQQFVNEYNMEAAFNLVQKAEKYISDEAKFKELATMATSKFTILTDPPGAEVYLRNYSDLEGEWKNIGTTPIDSIKIPSFTFYLMRIEKAGCDKVLAVATSNIGRLNRIDTLYRKLFRKETIPTDMVYVEGYMEEVAHDFIKRKNGFFMDRYEVTNKQFKEFVDNGGYRNRDYWKNEFIKNGRILTWEEAMAEFRDKSGRQGPSTWEAGDYPDGQDDYPVAGVSWYEAAAYAECAAKSLPTAGHWFSGTGIYMQSIRFYFNSKILPGSNFNGRSAEQVGKYPGVGCFGTYDMAGNVREWCWNELKDGRIISGGGWDDPNYTYLNTNFLPPFDRSNKNGFRCVQYIDKEKIPESAFHRMEITGLRDFSKEEPVLEDVFRIYKNQFLYDDKELGAVIEERDESPEDWIIEKISFNAGYGNERMMAYLCLPRSSSPPFQTIIFFPSIGSYENKYSFSSHETNESIDFILKNGRAVMFPVYKGTFERRDGMPPVMRSPNLSHQYTEWLIKWTKDFIRSVDYLETRTDIDSSKLGYYGFSWGGSIGGIIPAVEDRLKVNILVLGGFNSKSRAYSEADALNYVPRIRTPVLMLNGRYDMSFPLEIAVKPFFNLLGTPEKDKQLIIYETAHYVPRTEMIKESLNWLDRYLGPVK